MKPGIVVVALLGGELAERIHDVQRRFDPRMAAELPPHVTLVGSSGLGPVAVRTDVDLLRDAIAPAAAATPPMELAFEPPMRFMQSRVVVLPLDPHGPMRALHERLAAGIRAAKIDTERPRFTFTPHCTLSFYREQPPAELRALLTFRADGHVTVDRIAGYRAAGPTGTKCIIELPLGASSQA